jgi:hypothetical protein
VAWHGCFWQVQGALPREADRDIIKLSDYENVHMSSTAWYMEC